MENRSTYRTIEGISEGSYKEKGSKFLAFAVSCKTEEEVKAHLATWRKEHPQACHVCYAFRCGSDKKKFRSSDDGEPSNSAGPSILGQIQSFDLTNILVAVVRYYGGTNLGVGGLIQAYRTSAKEVLENAIIVEKEIALIVELTFGYEQMPVVMSAIKSLQLTIQEQQFELTCRIICELPISNQQALEKLTRIEHVILIEHGIKE